MTFLPVGFVSDGRALIPLDRYRELFRRQYHPGQEYTIMPAADRSMKAQGLYFKCIKLAWENLPDSVQRSRDSNRIRFPSESHLRSWCLIQEGFATRKDIACRDEDAAKLLIEECRDMDPYCVLALHGDVLTIWRAMSQDKHSMGNDVFLDSMDKVLARLSEMLGINTNDLIDQAKAAMTRRKVRRYYEENA